MIGRGERAWEYYKKICPSFLEDISELHRTEPYVYAQMIAGRTHTSLERQRTHGLQVLLHGTSTAISRFILGVRPTYDGLLIDPVSRKTGKALRLGGSSAMLSTRSW